MKTINFLFASIIIFSICATSCSTPKTSILTAQPTTKDSLMVQICTDYIPTSIVGEGGNLAKYEKAKRDYAKNLDRAKRLEDIDGIQIKRIPRENDSICDFMAEMDDILFAYDSFELTPKAIEIIDNLSSVIIDIPTRVEIVGHTDYYGTDEYNLNLSKMRAMAVGNRLRDNGITNITEIGKGESEPIATNHTAEGRKKNRRVEIKMFTEE